MILSFKHSSDISFFSFVADFLMGTAAPQNNLFLECLVAVRLCCFFDFMSSPHSLIFSRTIWLACGCGCAAKPNIPAISAKEPTSDPSSKKVSLFIFVYNVPLCLQTIYNSYILGYYCIVYIAACLK